MITEINNLFIPVKTNDVTDKRKVVAVREISHMIAYRIHDLPKKKLKKKDHVKEDRGMFQELKIKKSNICMSYILSLMSSSRFISFLANCCLRYSGATVTAVT